MPTIMTNEELIEYTVNTLARTAIPRLDIFDADLVADRIAKRIGDNQFQVLRQFDTNDDVYKATRNIYRMAEECPATWNYELRTIGPTALTQKGSGTVKTTSLIYAVRNQANKETWLNVEVRVPILEPETIDDGKHVPAMLPNGVWVDLRQTMLALDAAAAAKLKDDGYYDCDYYPNLETVESVWRFACSGHWYECTSHIECIYCAIDMRFPAFESVEL